MNKLLFPIIILLLVANVALADKLIVQTVNDQISPYDTAEYIITVVNEKNESDMYKIVAADIEWSIQTDPLTDYTTGLSVPRYYNKTTTLLAKPRVAKPFKFGKKSFQVDFRSEKTGEVLSAVLSADVRQDLIKYPFTIDTEFLMPEVIDPRQANSVKVSLKNNNLLNISGIVINVTSKFFEKSTKVDLLPEQEKVVDFSVSLGGQVAPQDDTATMTVSWNGTVIKTVKSKYTIAPYGTFRSEKSVEKSFLKTVTTIIYTNEGNSQKTESILLETTFFERLFTRTTPKTSVTKINDITYHTTNLTLGPQQTATVVIKTDYMPIIYIIVILIALAILYFVFRSPVIVAKEAKDVFVDQGGIRSVAIVVKIKNRSSKKLNNVKVTERVPSIAVVQLSKSDAMRPDKTFHYSGGIVMQYNLHKMEPGEIRFLTYHLKTKLHVVGNLRLKPVIIEYEDGKKTYSNPLDVYNP